MYPSYSAKLHLCLVAAISGGIAEMLSDYNGIDDNFSIPVAACTCAWFWDHFVAADQFNAGVLDATAM